MSGDMYDWTHCDHKGIGNIGCPVCDPDKGRVMIRQQRLDNRDLRAEVARLTEQLATMREWADRADHFPLCPAGSDDCAPCACGKAAALSASARKEGEAMSACECDDDMTEDGHGSMCPNGVTNLRAQLAATEALLAATQEQHARAAAEAVRLRAALEVAAEVFDIQGRTLHGNDCRAALRGEP